MMDLKKEAVDLTSKKFDLSILDTKNIIDSQFSYVIKKCRNLEEVKLRYFGTWMIKPTKKDEALLELENENLRI